MGAFSPGAGEVNLTAPDGARRVRNANVDEHLLDALGLQAAEGRLFARGETDRTNPAAPLPPVAILSHELWQSAFGGQPIIGKMVEVNSRPREVIGIMPPGADVLDIRPEIWLPLGLNPSNRGNRGAHYLRVIGRLKDDVTPEAAQRELTTLNEQWGERVGVSDHMFAPNAGHILQLAPLHDQIVSGASRAIWMLQATAGLVLLIACANLANLLLARAAIRRRESAVRTALGASRRRLLRQFMTEGALLSIAGSALGVWLAHVGLRTLAQAYPAALPRSTEVSVDLPVLLFACGVAIATTMFFGLAQLRHIGVKDLARHAHRRRQQRRQRRDTPSRPPRPGDGRSRSGRHPRDRRGPAHTHRLQSRERRPGIQSVAPGDVLYLLAGKHLCNGDDSSAGVSASAGRAPRRPWCGGSDGHVRAAAESAAPHGQYTRSPTPRLRRWGRSMSLITIST